jgi:cobalt-zinc-cadmium efflux system protein
VWTFALTLTFLVVEVIAAIWTGSLTLLADAGHMLTDVGGLAPALIAVWFGAKPATPAKTYGYYRVEILAALANAVLLLIVAGFILSEAYRRLLSPPEILAGPMLAVGAVGLIVNGGRHAPPQARRYRELERQGRVPRSAERCITGWTLVDPLIGAAIGLFILPRTWNLLRQAVNILLEGTPPHLDLLAVEAVMRQVQGVRDVHDLHVWTVTSGKHAMSAHVLVDDLAQSGRVLRELHALLHDRFAIDHTTIQIETPSLLAISRPQDARSR